MNRKLAGSRAEARWRKRGLKGEAAFTLVELLVVIAIISIIAALVLPVMGRAKSAAQKTTCINDLHQINVAVLMYADDHADSFHSPSTDYRIYFSYKDSIGSYLAHSGLSTNDQQFKCPADDFKCTMPAVEDFFWPDNVGGRGFWHLNQTHHSSYVFNGAAAKSAETRVAEKRFSSVREPSRLILVCELSTAIGLSGHDRRKPGQFNNAMNVVSFVDGHVSFVPIYWNGNSGQQGMPVSYDPPAGYQYTWFEKAVDVRKERDRMSQIVNR